MLPSAVFMIRNRDYKEKKRDHKPNKGRKMSPTHPFRTSRRSPHDDNGPNSAALRRSLASLQTHDRGTPPVRVSAEPQRQSVERPSVEIPKQTRQEYAPQKALATDPLPETQPRTIDSPQAKIPQPEQTEDEEMEDPET